MKKKLMQPKEKRVTVRFTPEQYKSVRARAESAHMAVSTYMRACSMRHKVVVVNGLKDYTRELKAIGRNLNQLVILSHEGRITTVNLESTLSALERYYIGLCELSGKECQ